MSGDSRLLTQKLSAMEAQVSQAITLKTEVVKLTEQLRDKEEEIASMQKPGEPDPQAELRAKLAEEKAKVAQLRQDYAIITRERELGISDVGGSVSQERYDLLLAENQRLVLQLERGELDGGGGLGMADLEELTAVKRDVKKMKQDRAELQQKYETQLALNKELQEQGPAAAFATENPTTIKELREKMAHLVVENKRIAAAANSSHRVMVDAQSEVEKATIEVENIRLEKDKEIAVLHADLERLQAEWGEQKKAMEWAHREEHQSLRDQLTHESQDNQKLAGMLEELMAHLSQETTAKEQAIHQRDHWHTRADHAEKSLRAACELQGVPVPEHNHWQDLHRDFAHHDFAPKPSGFAGIAAAALAQQTRPEEGLPPQHQHQQLAPPPPPQQQYGHEGQSTVSYQTGQQQHPYALEAPPQTMMPGYQNGMYAGGS